MTPQKNDPRLVEARNKTSAVTLSIPRALASKKSRDEMAQASAEMLRRRVMNLVKA